MSIVTTAQAVPSRLFAIYASLFESDAGELKDRIEAWATPPSLSGRGADDDGESTTTLFSNTLQEARRIGLVEDMDEKLRLTADARGGGKKGHDSEVHFLDYMKRTLFDPLRAVETQQAGFMIALAWFLSSNPLRPINFSEAPQVGLRAQIGDHASKTELTSLNRYQNFLYWARYLGFATIVGGRDADDQNARRVIPDPVRAIEGALAAIFAESRELPVEQFLTRLSGIFPVFEKGSVREDYEAMRLIPVPDVGQRLSVTTSVALQRLADRQRIALTSVADAPARILDFGSREGRVSHIALRT
ncbi:protein DpdG [Mesorhizobium sp. M0977]|uniref:protein DpdG n=1 Tax=Mesorhizobium sp. M0977 TaxID=2957039 RepID=UPI00333DFE00